ncbi:MAG: nickel-responsive transcriptional regulator NikR [Nitrospirae bacterium]|nr:nickel-responsive transcriptional regulator NikR [Nitrospirota bacterium]
MSELARFGVSIDAALLEQFDEQIERKGYSNRSEALRDLIRDHMVTEEWHNNEETVGTITIVYDHHTRELSENLTHLQHSFEGEIISVLHVHLDHHNCLEVLVVRGRSQLLQHFADRLVGTRGVRHGKLTMTTTGRSMVSCVGCAGEGEHDHGPDPNHGHNHGHGQGHGQGHPHPHPHPR